MEKIRVLSIEKLPKMKRSKSENYGKSKNMNEGHKIKQNNKIITDNDEEIYFSDEEIFKYNIYTQREYSKADWNEMIKNIEVDRVYNKALGIILFKKNSRRMLIEKLLAKGFKMEFIEEAIVKLEELKYIDDKKFAENYVKSLSMGNKGKTVSQIEQALWSKGIDNEIIKEVITKFRLDVNQEPESEYEKIKQFINNKYFNLINDTNIDYNKLISIKRSLYGKGFNPDTVDEVMYSIWENMDNNW